MQLIKIANRLVLVKDGRRYCVPFGYAYENNLVKLWSLDDTTICFESILGNVLNEAENPFAGVDELEIFLVPLLGFNTATGGSVANYSTVEQLTGQKWLDGSDIYQKTIESLVDTGDTVVIELDALQIVNLEGSYFNASNNQFSFDTTTVWWVFYPSSTELLVNNNLGFPVDTVFTVKYIKP